MGNLTRDPELRQLPTGTSVANFGLAMNRRYKTREGEDREETCFVDIEVFGRQAETTNTYLSKGSSALVEGRLRLDQWEDKQSGQKRSRLLVNADRVQFLGARGAQSQQTPSSNTAGMDSSQDTGGGAPEMPQQPNADNEPADDIPF